MAKSLNSDALADLSTRLWRAKRRGYQFARFEHYARLVAEQADTDEPTTLEELLGVVDGLAGKAKLPPKKKSTAKITKDKPKKAAPKVEDKVKEEPAKQVEPIPEEPAEDKPKPKRKKS